MTSKAPNGYVKCDCCGKKYPSLFTDDNVRQGKNCASVYANDYIYGNYGSTKIDMDVYEIVYPPKWLKNHSLLCDSCVEKLDKGGHLKFYTSGVW